MCAMRELARSRKNLLALTVLSLLAEAPRHPYAMQGLIRERHHWFAEAPSRRLYHIVDRFVRDGLIVPLETAREGRRPERTIYQMTDEGKEEFSQWLGELLRTPAMDLTLLVGALSFMTGLAPTAVHRSLQIRLAYLDQEVASRGAAMRQAGSFVPRLFLLEEEYARTMLQAERDWIAALIDAIASGEITWDTETLKAAANTMSGHVPTSSNEGKQAEITAPETSGMLAHPTGQANP